MKKARKNVIMSARLVEITTTVFKIFFIQRLTGTEYVIWKCPTFFSKLKNVGNVIEIFFEFILFILFPYVVLQTRIQLLLNW